MVLHYLVEASLPRAPQMVPPEEASGQSPHGLRIPVEWGVGVSNQELCGYCRPNEAILPTQAMEYQTTSICELSGMVQSSLKWA